MAQFTPSQIASLFSKFAPAGLGISGSWLTPGTLPYDRIDQVSMLAGLARVFGTPRLETATSGSSFELAKTPVGVVQVFHKPAGSAPVLLVETDDFEITERTLTFTALGVGDKLLVYYQA